MEPPHPHPPAHSARPPIPALAGLGPASEAGQAAGGGGPFGSQSALWTQKVTFCSKSAFWSPKSILGSKSDFLRKVTPKGFVNHWFHKGLASWAPESDFGAKKSKKCPKVTFCSKIAKSDSRRQPALPLAKNTLQRSTPGKKNSS